MIQFVYKTPPAEVKPPVFSDVPIEGFFIDDQGHLCQKKDFSVYNVIADEVGNPHCVTYVKVAPSTLIRRYDPTVDNILKVGTLFNVPDSKGLTFADVKADQLFVNEGGQLCQKVQPGEYNIIANSEGTLWASNNMEADGHEEIQRIIEGEITIKF